MCNTTVVLRTKILKILSLLFLVRLNLYIPVPGIDLDLFSKGQTMNSIFSFAKTLTGSSFLGIGALGILPYINSSIIIQLLTSILPNLERLQKEEGELGRQKISQYTRYLTLVWAILLSFSISIFLIKPIVFDWSINLCLKVVLSLTAGSMITVWIAETITEEQLGNGSSMIIFINIVGSIPENFPQFSKNFTDSNYVNTLFSLSQGFIFYLFIVLIIVIFQDAYKKIKIISAKQVNITYYGQEGDDSSYIPIKLNQGGIMPLVFSSTVATLLQIISSSSFISTIPYVSTILINFSFLLNIILVIFFSCFYSILILKPKDIAENLAKMTYAVPGIKQGSETTRFLSQSINRLAFMGGIFLSFLVCFPILLGSFFKFFLFKNITSLLLLIGVITDVTSQIRSYLLSRNYEGLKKA